MRNTLKMKIVGLALATVMVVPTLVSAASGSLTGGVIKVTTNAHYAWADYSYNQVYARLVKGSGDTGYRYGWQSVATPLIENNVTYGVYYCGGGSSAFSYSY